MTSFSLRFPTSCSPRLFLLVGGVLLGCGSSSGVKRVRGDVSHRGRIIPASAYAYYVSALREETHGRPTRAETLYLATLKEDPKSGAAWAGLIRTSCQSDRTQLDPLLDAAVHAADRPALSFLEYGRCLYEEQSKSENPAPRMLKRAEFAARQALRQEPLLEGASVLLAKILDCRGRPGEAEHVRRGYELYARASLPALRESEKVASSSRIDELISKGDKDGAMDAAAGILTMGQFSLRAWALGHPDMALEVSELVLRNDPNDPDARLVALLEARPFGREAQLAPEVPAGHLSALGQTLYLFEVAGLFPEDARLLYEQAHLDEAAFDDPLIAWWVRQLLRRLNVEPTRSAVTLPVCL